jgi:hypothetical protein
MVGDVDDALSSVDTRSTIGIESSMFRKRSLIKWSLSSMIPSDIFTGRIPGVGGGDRVFLADNRRHKARGAHCRAERVPDPVSDKSALGGRRACFSLR